MMKAFSPNLLSNVPSWHGHLPFAYDLACSVINLSNRSRAWEYIMEIRTSPFASR